MSLPDSIQKSLEAADHAAIEDEWIEAVDARPNDLSYFAAVAQALVEADESELAKTLLRLLDEELEARDLWAERLRLLTEIGGLYLKPAVVQARVLEAVEQVHGASESLPEMLRISGLNRSTTDLRMLHRKVERLESLLRLDVGSVVHMDGKGVGTISAINFDLGSYKVDFERHAGLTVGFKAGAKMLHPLPVGHVLRTKIEDPQHLEQLRDEQPSELLREVLESYGEPLAAGEIRAALEGIVGKSAWSRWWSAARSHPQVLVTTDKRQRYAWAESSQDAFDSLLQAFGAADLDERLDLFAKNARQNTELAVEMATSLAETATALVTSEPGRAVEIWMALDRVGLAEEDADFSPRVVVSRADDVAGLLASAGTKPLREALLDAAFEVRPDWQVVFAAALIAETDVGTAAKIASELGEHAPERLTGAIDTILSQPQRCPAAFLWLAQAAGDDETLRRDHAARLFQRLLVAVGRREFSAYRNTLEPLLESGGTLPKLIGELAPSDASAAEAAVERSSLEEFVKEPLINAIHLRFPDLRSDSGNALYALPESIEQRRQEASHLLSTEIPANRKAIQEAAAMGDLRENFEYKSARERHEYLSARLGRLQTDLDRAQPIDFARLDSAEVRVGTTAVLEGADGARRQISILGPWESDPDNDLVSYLSDLGESLIGSTVGETAIVDGTTHEIVEIRPYREA